MMGDESKKSITGLSKLIVEMLNILEISHVLKNILSNVQIVFNNKTELVYKS